MSSTTQLFMNQNVRTTTVHGPKMFEQVHCLRPNVAYKSTAYGPKCPILDDCLWTTIPPPSPLFKDQNVSYSILPISLLLRHYVGLHIFQPARPMSV
jgi:hypothetical protein